MNKITLHLAEARGRNGWFRAREANVFTTNGTWFLSGPDKEIPAPYVSLDISSGKGRADTSPVILNMSREDAHKLGMALLTAVGGEVVYCLQEQDLKDTYEIEFRGEPHSSFGDLPAEQQALLLGAATAAVNDMDMNEWIIEAFSAERDRLNLDLAV